MRFNAPTMRATQSEAKAKCRRRFTGITQVASETGIHRTHLYRVLKGERTSPRLIRAYRAYLDSKGITPPANLP